MNRKGFLIVLIGILCIAGQVSAAEPEVLTGDTRLACEAVLCLASGTRPDECVPSIRKYFSISHRKPHKTLQRRLNFLKLCPAGDDGNTAQTINNTYSACGSYGHESAVCAIHGFGQAITGNCLEIQGDHLCTQFIASNNPEEEGTFGICLDKVEEYANEVITDENGNEVITDENGDVIATVEGSCRHFREDSLNVIAQQ